MGWSYKSMLQTFTTGDWSHLLWMRFLSCRTSRTYRRPNLRMRLQNCNLFRPVIFILPATIFRILDAGVASTRFVGKQNNSQTKSHREAPTHPYLLGCTAAAYHKYSGKDHKGGKYFLPGDGIHSQTYT